LECRIALFLKFCWLYSGKSLSFVVRRDGDFFVVDHFFKNGKALFICGIEIRLVEMRIIDGML
jgi:hypothetical protein